MELERLTNQLTGRQFESSIREKQTVVYDLDQKIKALNREKDIIAADSEDRVKLSLRKGELENLKKKHKKMQVPTSDLVLRFLVSLIINLGNRLTF